MSLSPVDANQDDQAEDQAGQGGQHAVLPGPGRVAGRGGGRLARDDQRVDQQAQAAEQQDLGQRRVERAAAGVLLGQAQGQGRGRGGRPPGPDQPGQAAERQHRARADQRRGDQRGRDAAQPDRRGQDQGQAGHELRREARTGRIVVEAGERQARVRAAERVGRVGDGQRAVVRDPVRHLQVGGRVTDDDDLLGPVGDLPGREARGYRDRGRHRPPGHRLFLAAKAGPVRGPLAQREIAQAHGERGEHEHTKGGAESRPASSSGRPAAARRRPAARAPP